MNKNGYNAASGLVHEFVQLSKLHFAGFICDRDNLKRRYVVEILLNSFGVAALIANDYDEALQSAGFGDGCYRFDYNFDPSQIADDCMVTARLANSDVQLVSTHHQGEGQDYQTLIHASNITLNDGTLSSGFIIRKRIGTVSWISGLTITAHLTFDRSSNGEGVGPENTIVVKEGGRIVVEKTIIPWQGIKTTADLAQRAASFSLALPPSFADGVPHKLDVSLKGGPDLHGSPLAIYVPEPYAFGECLTVANDILYTTEMTQQFLHRLINPSVPLDSGYEDWRIELQRFPKFSRTGSRSSVDIAIIIIGSDENLLKETLNSLEASFDADWTAVNVPTPSNDMVFESSDLAAAVDQISYSLGERLSERTPLVVISAGTRLHPSALNLLGSKILDNTKLNIVYADYEVSQPQTGERRKYPKFLPAPDYERWIEQAYPVNLFASSFSKISEASRLEITSTYRLCNALIDHVAPAISESTSHLPVVLADCFVPTASVATAHELGEAAILHFRARGFQRCTYSLRKNKQSVNINRNSRTKSGLVSVILEGVTMNSEKFARILSILQEADICIEIITSDGSRMLTPSESPILECIRGARKDLGSSSGNGPLTSNRASELNRLISIAKFGIISIIGRDIEPTSMDWLTEAIERLDENDAAAVSPVIRYADGSVREAGILFGSNFEPIRGLAGSSRTEAGYMDMLLTSHERSSLSISCCVLKKQYWQTYSEFDATYFPNFYFDIDLFLRIRTKGLRLIVQPCEHVVWVGSEPSLCDPHLVDSLARELARLRSRWGNLMCDDPSYNPNLGLPDSYHTLAWPPRSLQWRGGHAECLGGSVGSGSKDTW